MQASVEVLSPSEAARSLGISAKALRIYEARGLLRPTRTATGWRAYGPEELRRAAEVAALRSLGFSLVQVERVLGGVAEGLEPALADLQARLEAESGKVGGRLEKVRDLRRALAQGRMPALSELAGLGPVASEPMAVFDLPWPWGGERFELRGVRPLTYITGPLGSGKTRIALAIARHLPGAAFVGLERIERLADVRREMEADQDWSQRVEASCAWLSEDGAAMSDALVALVISLERRPEAILVIDVIEQGLDEMAQHALIAHLRRRGPERAPLFMLTRSSAILDLATATSDEAVIFCPANHSSPYTVRLVSGAPGFEAMASCLGTPEARARTAGMTAAMPERASA